MTPRTLSPFVALALVVAGCSSGDDTNSATTVPTVTTAPPATTPPTTAPAPTTTAAPEPTTPPSTAPATTEPPATTDPDVELTESELADRELARTALIGLDDFPEDWIEDPIEDDEDDPDTAAFEAQFDDCLGRTDDERVSDVLEDLTVKTGDFHPADDDSTTVSHEVVLAPDVETAIAAMSEVTIDGAESCLAGVIKGFYELSFSQDPTLADIGVGEVIVTRTENEQNADLAVGVLLEIPLTIGEDTVSQFLELLYQRQGRALSELSFTSFGTPFPRDGYAALSDETVADLAAIGS